jgi:hypothetical protein
MRCAGAASRGLAAAGPRGTSRLTLRMISADGNISLLLNEQANGLRREPLVVAGLTRAKPMW